MMRAVADGKQLLSRSELYVNTFDRARIRDRAHMLAGARLAASGIQHAGREQTKRLRPLLTGVTVIPASSEAWADEMATQIHGEMPWMSAATDFIWQNLRMRALDGASISINPLIIDCSPSVGKSAYCRRVAEILGVPSVDIDASKGDAGFEIVGLEKG